MKKKLNKTELWQLKVDLTKRGMLPCDRIYVYSHLADGQLPVIYIHKVDFVKDDRIQTIALSFDEVDEERLQKQLWKHFGKGGDANRD